MIPIHVNILYAGLSNNLLLAFPGRPLSLPLALSEESWSLRPIVDALPNYAFPPILNQSVNFSHSPLPNAGSSVPHLAISIPTRLPF